MQKRMIKEPVGISEHDISVLIVALRGAAMRWKDAPTATLLAIGTDKHIDARAAASFAHECEELARRIEKTRATVFNQLEHNILLAALRVCALEWPKMASWSVATKRAMMEKFAAECAALSDRLDSAVDLPSVKFN